MGGLFRAPKPMVVDPSEDTLAKSAAGQQAQAAAAADAALRDGRAESRARAQRGMAGTIATGARGVLEPLPAFATRKTLLGE